MTLAAILHPDFATRIASRGPISRSVCGNTVDTAESVVLSGPRAGCGRRAAAPAAVSKFRSIDLRRVSIVLLLGGALFASGAEVMAQPAPAAPQDQAQPRAKPGARSMGLHMRRDRMLRHALARIGASKEQQQKIADIWREAHTDIHALREKRMAARKTIADQTSARLTKAIEDSAEVLTPEQRVAFAQQMQHQRGRHGRQGPHRS